ncbi:hypothetical protein NC651_038463 [Populus alba x Populus x berolinensis]|nr:hypothetical protein NC651_038463 [Populus alba x Populus x berolinensis]
MGVSGFRRNRRGTQVERPQQDGQLKTLMEVIGVSNSLSDEGGKKYIVNNLGSPGIEETLSKFR